MAVRHTCPRSLTQCRSGHTNHKACNSSDWQTGSIRPLFRRLLDTMLVSLHLFKRRITLTMPAVFQYPTTQAVAQLGFDEPVPEPHIILPRTPLYGLSCHGKLRAARHTDLFRDRHTRKELFESALEDILDRLFLVGRRVSDGRYKGIHRGAELNRAAEHPYAAEVDIAFLSDVSEAQVTQG